MTLTEKFRKFLIVFLSILTAISMALFTACDNTEDDTPDDNDDTTTEETITDFQLVYNGDFEFYTNEKTTYPYSSAIKWTRSNDKSNTTAISSTGTSGIIDTSDDAYLSLAKSSKPIISETETETTFFNPHTPSYYGLLKNEYDAENEDVRHNPNVAGNKVLMINNKTSIDGQGTAQKFTSSASLVIPQNSYGILSLWVNTYDLDTIVYDRKQSKEYGAYVSLTNSVGNVDYDNILVKNINTEGKWVNLKLFVQGSDINSTSYGITVGLGQGSKNNKDGYVEGFAYFDNISFATYTKTEFMELDEVKSIGAPNFMLSVNDSTNKADFVQSLANVPFVANGDKADYVDETTATAKYTKLTGAVSYPSGISYTTMSSTGSNQFAWNKNVTNKTYDFETGNTLAIKKISDLTDGDKALFDDKVDFTKLSNDGYAAYIHFTNSSSATFKSNTVTVPKESRKAVTFYTQSKVTNSSDCVAKVTINELDKDAVDLFTDVTTVNEEGDYGYWTKYTVYVYNPTDEDTSFTIGLTFGLVEGEVTDTPSRDLPTGYAIIADMQVADVTEDVYENVLTNSFANKQTLYGNYVNFTEEDEKVSLDEYNITPDINQEKVISIKPTTSVPNFTFIGDRDKTESGIVNSKYVNADGTYGSSKTGVANLNLLSSLTTLRSDGITYNENAQAIILSNKQATSSAFVTSKATIAANSYSTIIVYVRATGDAVANVYLSGTSFNENTKKYDLITIEGDENKSATISAKATATSHLYDEKWTEICFYVATGNEPIDYRVEIWNGTRDGSANSVGTVFIDNVYVADSSAEAFAFDKKQYSDEYAKLGDSYKFTGFNYTRVATVKYTDSDGETAEKTKTFEPTEVYAGNDLIKFVSYETIDVDSVIDETTSVEDTEEDDDTTTEEDPYKASLTQNLPLLIISGIIAVALIVAIIVVLIRSKKKKTTADAKKKEEYYSRDARDVALQKILEKKSKINVDLDEEEKEYDYEEAAQISDEETDAVTEVTEETVEPTEEVIDLAELEKEPEVLNEDKETNDNE